MGVVISKPAINLREQLTELKATQGYEERQFHFDNLVTNGTFDTDTSGWTANSGSTATWNNGTLRVSRTSFSLVSSDAIATVVGRTYVISADIVSGIGRISVTGSFDILTQSGSATFQATSTSTVIDLRASADGGVTDFDNISVYEVDPADDKVIHTMPKGWKPLHVFEDGALQREGSAYDYTVEYDGFNYIVKETVAPVAPYSTTVIGVRA